MSDYIKRKDAKELLWRRLMQTANNNFGFKAEADRVYFDAAERITSHWIDEIPAADVVERKRGKWKELTRYGMDSQRAICECSACGGNAWVYDDEKRRFKYCPNCGAKMESADDV